MSGSGPIERALTGPEVQETVYHYPLESTSNEGGNAVQTYGDLRKTTAHVTDPAAADFDIRAIGGVTDSIRFFMYALAEDGFGFEDRVWYDNGLTFEPYRLAEGQPDEVGDETLVRWTLIEDSRGEGQNGTGAEPPRDGSGGGNGNGGGGTGDPLNVTFTVSPDQPQKTKVTTFDASATTAPGKIQGYSWDFGDGETGVGAVVEHTYADTGNFEDTYTVTLEVAYADGAGGTATATTSKDVTQGPPF